MPSYDAGVGIDSGSNRKPVFLGLPETRSDRPVFQPVLGVDSGGFVGQHALEGASLSASIRGDSGETAMVVSGKLSG